MSKDIRSFFQVLSKKPSDQPKPVQKPKKPAVLIDSDDEDVISDTPEKVSSKKPPPKRRAQVLSSDSEDESKSEKQKSPAKKPKKVEEKPKLRLVNLDALNKPVKQSKVEHVPKPEATNNKEKNSHKEKESNRKKNKNKKNTEIGVHGDKDFEKTLEELDDDSDDTILLENLDILDKTIEEAVLANKFDDNVNQDLEKGEKSHTREEKHVKKSQDETNLSKDKKHKEGGKETKTSTNKYERKRENGHSEDKKHKKERKEENSKDEKVNEKGDAKDGKHKREHNSPKKDKEPDERCKEKSSERKDTPKKGEKRRRKNSETTPNKKQKLEHTDSGIDPDQEKWEKKRYSAGLYQAYLHRPGPKNHGQKVYPKGKADCLSGLTFLRTGVLDSLEGEDFQGLVTEHGGRVVHSVSKKVHYVVVGDEPGPAKFEKAKSYKIPILSEDEFLDMILVKSGKKPKYAVNNYSEDFGLGTSENGSDDLDKKLLEIEDSCESIEVGDSKESKKREDCHKNVKEEIDSKFNNKKINELQKTELEETKNKIIKMETKKNDLLLKKLDETVTKKDLVNVKKQSVVTQSTGIGSSENLSWTEKYKPSCIKDIIGQQDPNSNMNKLKRWLEDWFKNQDPERRKKMRKPNPFRPCGSGEYFKAALLSGPPGLGKTTTATLVAQELGFDIVEFNASDTRNKKLLHEEISQMMSSKTVAGFASGDKNVNKKRVLLMDEVDGMAGNEDRGGIAELISFIKTANFPIICMCNNREHQKMRTLVNYCFELKFGKPNVNQVRGAMLSICFKEGLKIKPDALARLIIGTGSDIRQTLNHLAMWSAAEKEISSDVVAKESKNSQKDVVMGTWDVIRKVFTKSMNKDMSLSDKSRLFFYDYSLGPLFVQENYLHVTPECTGSSDVEFEEELIRRYLTADSLSMSDLIESKIRSTNNWSLLESQAFYSTVLPSHYMSGKMEKCNFPTWFGLNSRRNKKLRIISELYSHARTRVSGDKNSMHLDYAEYLRDLLLKPLKEKGIAGIGGTLEVMKSYSLLRDDMLNLFDLLHRFNRPNLYEQIDVSVKVALTKLYNKKMVINFAPPVASKKKKGGKDEGEELPVEEEELSDEEETEENVTDDALIKVKTKAAPKAGSSKGKASTTKAETKGKGKSSKRSEGKGSNGKGKK